jgi:hypothetical protein
LSVDERQVTTALKRYARDVSVTDDDLDRLHARVEERVHPSRRGDRSIRPWEVAVAACAVVALVLAATALWRTSRTQTMPAVPVPTPSTAPVSARDLVGAWMVDEADSNGHVWYFTADGRWTTANTPAEHLDLAADLSAYSVEQGNIVVFESCRAVDDLDAEGRMSLTPQPIREACPWATGTARPFVRLSPASPAGRALLRHPFVYASQPPTPVDSVADLVGTWMLRGTGTMLVVTDLGQGRGQYVADDDGDAWSAPDERGTLTVGADGVTLHPTVRGDPDCAGVLGGLVTTRTTLLGPTLVPGCALLTGSDGSWFRMS